MRRLVVVLALLGATGAWGQGVADGQDVPPAGECPAGTMGDDGNPTGQGHVLCVCTTDVSQQVVSYGYGDSGEVITIDFSDPAGCPVERPPVPPEDCADAPPTCETEVLSAEVTAVVVADAPVAAATPSVAPVFTG